MTTLQSRTAARRVSALLAIAALASCDRPPAPAAESAPDATYTVRAEIVRLPAAPGGELYLRHESIAEFRNSKAETVGMMSMTMPFGAPAELDLGGAAVGDRVEATFEVRWSTPAMPLRVTRLVPLPPGTRLEFDPHEAESAADAGDATAAGDADQPAGETPR